MTEPGTPPKLRRMMDRQLVDALTQQSEISSRLANLEIAVFGHRGQSKSGMINKIEDVEDKLDKILLALIIGPVGVIAAVFGALAALI